MKTDNCLAALPAQLLTSNPFGSLPLGERAERIRAARVRAFQMTVESTTRKYPTRVPCPWCGSRNRANRGLLCRGCAAPAPTLELDSRVEEVPLNLPRCRSNVRAACDVRMATAA